MPGIHWCWVQANNWIRPKRNTVHFCGPATGWRVQFINGGIITDSRRVKMDDVIVDRRTKTCELTVVILHCI